MNEPRAPGEALSSLEQVLDRAVERHVIEGALARRCSEPSPTPTAALVRPSSAAGARVVIAPARLCWRGVEVSEEFQRYAERVARGEDLGPFRGQVLATSSTAFPWRLEAPSAQRSTESVPPRVPGWLKLLAAGAALISLVGLRVAEVSPPEPAWMGDASRARAVPGAVSAVPREESRDPELAKRGTELVRHEVASAGAALAPGRPSFETHAWRRATARAASRTQTARPLPHLPASGRVSHDTAAVERPPQPPSAVTEATARPTDAESAGAPLAAQPTQAEAPPAAAQATQAAASLPAHAVAQSPSSAVETSQGTAPRNEEQSASAASALLIETPSF